ncbi:MAG: hypothetical protein KH547_12130, partial [Roseburia sp.]|nr:hypothetical protein [Roseburia sp.]
PRCFSSGFAFGAVVFVTLMSSILFPLPLMAARKTAQRQSSTPGAQKNRGGWFYSILAALRPFYKGQTAENV